MIDENERVVCPPVLIVEAVSCTSPAGAETATFAWDLPFAGAFFGLDAVFTAGVLPLAGALLALDAVFTAGVLPLAGALLALDAVFTAETLALDAAGLAVDAPDLTVFAVEDAPVFAGTRFFTDDATGFSTDFAFDFTALATEPALDDITFFAAIFNILENQLKESHFLPFHGSNVNETFSTAAL